MEWRSFVVDVSLKGSECFPRGTVVSTASQCAAVSARVLHREELQQACHCHKRNIPFFLKKIPFLCLYGSYIFNKKSSHKEKREAPFRRRAVSEKSAAPVSSGMRRARRNFPPFTGFIGGMRGGDSTKFEKAGIFVLKFPQARPPMAGKSSRQSARTIHLPAIPSPPTTPHTPHTSSLPHHPPCTPPQTSSRRCSLCCTPNELKPGSKLRSLRYTTIPSICPRMKPYYSKRFSPRPGLRANWGMLFSCVRRFSARCASRP